MAKRITKAEAELQKARDAKPFAGIGDMLTFMASGGAATPAAKFVESYEALTKAAREKADAAFNEYMKIDDPAEHPACRAKNHNGFRDFVFGDEAGESYMRHAVSRTSRARQGELLAFNATLPAWPA